MPGLIRGVARTAAVAGTASAVGGRVQHRQQQKWAKQEQQAQPQQAQQAPLQQPVYAAPAPQQQPVYAAPAPAPAAPPPAGDMASKIALIKQLGELRDNDFLTEAEFETQKAKILA
ncbi:MAG: SHOCT domain-containing protein [Actinomycetes bacterium]